MTQAFAPNRGGLCFFKSLANLIKHPITSTPFFAVLALLGGVNLCAPRYDSLSLRLFFLFPPCAALTFRLCAPFSIRTGLFALSFDLSCLGSW